MALPAVLLLGISKFQRELSVLHIRIIFFPFDVALTLSVIAQFLRMIALFLLLLRRACSRSVFSGSRLWTSEAVEVQQVILPEALARYGNLSVQTEYRAGT